MLDIYVDADACPVKAEVIRVAERYDLNVFIVSNSPLHISAGSKVQMIVVEAGWDAADDWIFERACINDLVITADILLAERCLKNKATVIAPSGKPFTSDNIGSAIAMRALSAHLREIGEVSGGQAPFGKRDRSLFLQTMDNAIQAIKRC